MCRYVYRELNLKLMRRRGGFTYIAEGHCAKTLPDRGKKFDRLFSKKEMDRSVYSYGLSPFSFLVLVLFKSTRLSLYPQDLSFLSLSRSFYRDSTFACFLNFKFDHPHTGPMCCSRSSCLMRSTPRANK